MTDTLPLISDVDPAVRAIFDEAFEQLGEVLVGTFQKASELPGNEAERENDALSVSSELCAVALLHFILTLREAKQQPLSVVTGVALQDVMLRLRSALDQVPEATA